MYAIIATGGKQYKVQENDKIDIEYIEGEVGKKITFNEVLAIGEGEKLDTGTPLVKGAKVEAEIIDQFRGKKVVAFKMKKRKGYRRKKGHRQELTRVQISSVAGK